MKSHFLIAYVDGWCVVTLPDWEVVAGPYTTHQEAVEAAETRAHRIRQGWAP